MDREEAEFRVNNLNAIFAIEDMEMTEKEKEVCLSFYMGELSKEEFRKAFLNANNEPTPQEGQ